jgi:hypothetical protein
VPQIIQKTGKKFTYSVNFFVNSCVYITHLPNGGQLAASIEPVEDADFKKITKKRYFFDWNVEKSHSVYKLTLEGGSDILGLVSLHDFDNEQRIEIRLLAVSKENMGTGKNIEGIAGNLIVFAARRAVKNMGRWRLFR